jgi:hypothetical protein
VCESIAELYAPWGVDCIKADDMARRVRVAISAGEFERAARLLHEIEGTRGHGGARGSDSDAGSILG